MFIKKCDFKCIKILAECDTRTAYHCHFTITCFWLSREKYINLVLPMLRPYTNKWIKYIIKLSVSIKLFMSCFIAQDCVCTASKLLCFKSSDYCNEAP
jgi:hypothetical protein